MSEYIIECEYDSDEGWIPGEHREEIVRCRDCEYYTEDDWDICEVWDESVEPDGFCSCGKKRRFVVVHGQTE